MNVLQMLASSSFITLNKNIIKAVGLEEALILGELSSEYDYWLKRDELKEGWFFSTVENIEEHTTLNDYKQRKAITNLKNLNIIDVKVKGTPAKRYFKINEEQVFKILDMQFLKNSNSSSQKFKELDLKNFDTNNNIVNNNINNNKDNIYSAVCSYLNEKAGTSYRSTTSATQRLIRARQNEGFTLDDFKKVIDNKCAEWLNSDMSKYLRPETLFGTKFESYLNSGKKEKEKFVCKGGLNL